MTVETLVQIVEAPDRFFNQGFRLETRINAKRERMRHWRELAESITVNPENSGSGGGGFAESKLEKCVIELQMMQGELAEEIAELHQLGCDISEAIGMIDNPNYKTILELRYVSHMSFEQISVTLNYTYRWTQELLHRAVLEVQEQAIKRVNSYSPAV